jgi:hypothetical protein
MSTNGANDHPEIEKGIIARANVVLAKPPFETRMPNNLTIARLTDTVLAQVSKLSAGDMFTLLNLEHYGPPVELFDVPFLVGIGIKEHGINTPELRLPPILDLERAFLLQQAGIVASIPVKQPMAHEGLILHNECSIAASLHGVYGETMGYSLEEIQDMNYYARTYRMIGLI